MKTAFRLSAMLIFDEVEVDVECEDAVMGSHVMLKGRVERSDERKMNRQKKEDSIDIESSI